MSQWTAHCGIRSNHTANFLDKYVYRTAGVERWVGVVGLGACGQTKEGSHGFQLRCWYCLSLGPRPVSKHGSPERRNRTWNQLHMKALFRLQRCMKVRKWGKMNGEHACGFASKVLDSLLTRHVPCISWAFHIFWKHCLSPSFGWNVFLCNSTCLVFDPILVCHVMWIDVEFLIFEDSVLLYPHTQRLIQSWCSTWHIS